MAITDPLIGKKLGDYTIEIVLGTGGMARVYRGYDEKLDRHAAVKVIEPQLIASTEDEDYRGRFLREARAIARLNHPRIVSIYQFNQVGALYYIAMEYAEGANLREVLKGYIRQGKVMPTAEFIKVLKDMADALDYAHKQGIIHRDIKPSNIIITPEGNAVLTDFGLALNATEGTIGNTFGSVHYIAPEQAVSSSQAVPQSDQYSLAIVAYELLTGRVPFDDASAMSIALKHISDPPPPPTELNPNIPPEVEQVILKALDKEPERRFSTAKDFVNAIEMAFTMFDNADIEPPDSLTAAIDGQPETAAFPPLDMSPRASSSTKNDTVQDALTNTKVLPADDDNRNNLFLVAGFIVIAAIIGSFLFLNGLFGDDTAMTETAVALAEEVTLAAGLTATSEDLTAVSAVVGETTETDESPTSTEAIPTNMATSTVATNDDATETDNATATLAASDTPQATATSEPSNTPVPTVTLRPTNSPTPSFTIVDENDTRQVLLRYDGRSIVVSNRDVLNTIDLSDLRFVLFEPDEDGNLRQTTSFNLSTSNLSGRANNMTPDRCLQLLDNSQYGGLPSSNPIADDICTSTPFWLTTTRTFWTSRSRDAYFEVRLGPIDVVGICEVQAPLTRSEQRCALDLRMVLP